MTRLPSFNISAITDLRSRLIERVFLQRYHETVEGVQLDYLVNDLSQLLPKPMRRDAIFETARQLLGIELTPEVCFNFSWMLAGNVPTLKAGRAVMAWHGQVSDEWVPLQATRCELQRHPRTNDLGDLLTLRILAGSPTGMVTTRFLSRRFATALGRRIGFSASYEKYPFSEAKQLVGLRFLGEIMAAKSHKEPRFENIKCPASLIDYNREVLKIRLHHVPCERGYTHPCHRCVIGYRDCPAGTHRETYVKQFCTKCGEENYFDPDAKSEHCIKCSDTAKLKKPSG
jgi:hypothetical protein